MRSLISCNKKWVVDVMSISPGVSVMKINIRVQSSQNYPCQLCSVEGKLSSHRLNIFSEFGSFTNATGFASVTFRFDGDRMEMDFYVAVTGIENMQNAVPAHDCLYTRDKSIITHQELIQGICTTDFFKVGVLLTTFQPMKSQALEPTCTRNFGQGFWSILTKGYTEVKDIYQWKEDGCRIVNMSAKYFLSTLQKNTKIAFVGDSVLGNVYKDFLSFLHVPIKDKEAEYALDNGSALKYFLTYGYYTFNNTCCGEIDCRVRQQVRKGKLGFSKLKAALQWIRQSANCVLIVQSPAIHHARSHVTENVHAGLVKQIIIIMHSVNNCRLVWFSTSPMGTHIIPKEKYVNNRSHRRWRLYNMEKQVIRNQADILWFDVWNLFWTRKDRFRDATHVDLVDKYRPPIIPSTCTAMLKHVLVPGNVQYPGEQILPV